MEAVTGPPTPAEAVVSGWQTPNFEPVSPPNYANVRSAFQPWIVNGGAPANPLVAERPWIAPHFVDSPVEMTQEEFQRMAASVNLVGCF